MSLYRVTARANTDSAAWFKLLYVANLWGFVVVKVP